MVSDTLKGLAVREVHRGRGDRSGKVVEERSEYLVWMFEGLRKRSEYGMSAYQDG